MEGSDRREPIVLYEVPLLPELEVRALIIKSLPQAVLSPQHIILRKKEGRYQAFVLVPVGLVQEICALKELTINKETVCIKRSFTEAQVFIGRLPDTLSIDEIREYLQAEFGKVVKIHEGQPHQETKSKLRHCYIQFQREEDAEKVLLSSKKLLVKSEQLRPSRAYAMNQSDETDKKLFLKIVNPFADQEDLERAINEEFRRHGKLREKIKVDNGKATIVYTSAEVADRVLQTFKSGKIGNYEVVLRPFANKDSYTVFLSGLKPTVTQEQLETTFKNYQPLISSGIMPSSNPQARNGTITFGSQETYKKLLVEYKEDDSIRHVFVGNPFITQHMNAKDRHEYQSFRKGKMEPKKVGPMIPPPPIGFQMYPPMQQVSFVPQMSRPPMMGPMPSLGNMGTMGNFGYYQP